MAKIKKLLVVKNHVIVRQTNKILRSQCTQRIGKLLYWSLMSHNELADLEIRLQKMYPEINRLPIIKLSK